MTDPRIEQFVRDIADLPEKLASRRIINEDPAGMLWIMIDQAKELLSLLPPNDADATRK